MSKMSLVNAVFFLLVIFLLSDTTFAGILSYGICQSGCNVVAVACYAAAGFTCGTVTAGAGIPIAIVTCNAALGTCMAGCIAAGCVPFIP